jgi:hypothetical protein
MSLAISQLQDKRDEDNSDKESKFLGKRNDHTLRAVEKFEVITRRSNPEEDAAFRRSVIRNRSQC